MQPKLRFNGFTSPWQILPFEESFTVIPYKQFVSEPTKKGLFPVIQQGDVPISGFSNNTPYQEYIDAIVFGDHTISLYKPTTPFLVVSDGIKILKAKNTSGDFLYYFLNKYKPETEGYKRHYGIFAKCNGSYPKNKKEETKITLFFKQLDEQVNCSEAEIARLKQLKKGALQAMFPQPGENIPKIRFNGFSNPWQQVHLNEICSKIASSHSENALGPNIGSFPIFGATGYIQNINTYDMSTPYIGIVKDGSGAGRANIYPSNSSLLGTMQYIIPKEQTNITFLLCQLQSIDFSIFTTGSSIPHIYFRDYGELKVLVPSYEEQAKIGEFFKQLDAQISLQEKKLLKLKQLKQASLNQMFV